MRRTTAALARELEAPDGCTPLAMESAVLSLISDAIRGDRRMGQGRPPTWLGRARDVIRETYREGIPLDSVARAAGVSRSQVARGFRAWLGTSPGAYQRQLRLERAALELRTTGRALIDVALDCGFCDQSHFTNAFRRHYGTTPSAYRVLAAASR